MAQNVSTPVEEVSERRYQRVEVENAWDYATPQAAGVAVYGQGPTVAASHASIQGGVSGGGTTPPSTPTTCTDPIASNFGGPLPCDYGLGSIDFGGPTTCNDPTANNFGGILPCNYDN